MNLYRIVSRACLPAAACVAIVSSPASAQSAPASAPASICPEQTGMDEQSRALLATLMLESRSFSSLADMFAALPVDARATFAAMQAAEAERAKTDWANLCRYAAENAQVAASGTRPRVVFLGDSITENWLLGDPALFGPTVLNRGIGGQTTPQILLRFYQDVVTLRPHAVHIMAGVNDIMGNQGPSSDTAIVNNVRAMIDIAKANDIRVVLAGITPAQAFLAWPDVDLRPRIAEVNRQLALLADEERIAFVDYSPVLANDDAGLRASLGNDGLHPNRAGYAAMRSVADRAVTRAAR